MDWLKKKDASEVNNKKTGLAPWKILIVDDDDQVHLITRQALKRFTFQDKNLEFFSAYSAEEARKYLAAAEHKFAIILLDVVMEEDDSGLKLADFIRYECRNSYSRIILRTGQPGVAPEYSVIKDYDIDAYRNKTELKQSDLESIFYTSLRSYRDINSLKAQRNNIEQLVKSITNISTTNDLPEFASVLLKQIEGFTGTDHGQLLLEPSESYAVSKGAQKTRILAMTPESINISQDEDLHNIEGQIHDLIEKSLLIGKDIKEHPYYIHYQKTQRNNEIIMALKSREPLSDEDEKLLNLFSTNVSLSYENLMLHDEITESQRLLIRLLGGAMESRSMETGSHVKRVGDSAALLAELSGKKSNFIERIRMAAPLHDVGKVGTPDAILNKPGALTSEEWTIMKEHSLEGYEILKDTDNPIIDMAAQIALDHHERWDGGGYPGSKKADDISQEGQIVSLVDVTDALLSNRCYKKAWPFEKVAEIIKEGSGTQFRPELVELFLRNQNRFLEIFNKNPD
jgi:response regulator RpfG family c-di-GMP phosphodiesterase